MNMHSFFSALKPRHWGELGRHFRNRKYEYDDEGGLLISHARIAGVYECEAPDGWVRSLPPTCSRLRV